MIPTALSRLRHLTTPGASNPTWTCCGSLAIRGSWLARRRRCRDTIPHEPASDSTNAVIFEECLDAAHKRRDQSSLRGFRHLVDHPIHQCLDTGSQPLPGPTHGFESIGSDGVEVCRRPESPGEPA